MKRRDLLKGLSILPFGIKALREKPKEEVKPEPVKVEEPRVTLQLSDQKCLTAVSYSFPPEWFR